MTCVIFHRIPRHCGAAQGEPKPDERVTLRVPAGGQGGWVQRNGP